jgi:alpha-glucosidase (family GH31 glycosyl hydrolase)
MLRKFLIISFCQAFVMGSLMAQTHAVKLTIDVKKGEKWWGGAVNDGVDMPFRNGFSYEMYGNEKGNQAQPLLVSNLGRVIWSEEPFKFTITDTNIQLEGEGQLLQHDTQGTLQDAFKYASKNYFPPNGKMPDAALFSAPQYNTWIELTYNQNQADVLKYAHAIIDNGFAPGVLMIDDTWQEAYGKWIFHPGRFPNPKAMMTELHNLGFKVMVWVCPFVSADTDVFRDLSDKDLFLKYPANQAIAGVPRASNQKTAMVAWWNGVSGLLDFSNMKAQEWFQSQLQYLTTEYGVDGFKLDAGDAEFYPDWLISHKKNVTPNEHTALFGEIGLKFPLNEYRATWKMAGLPLAQRLRDKGHTWADLGTLIPNITVQGLMGYAFTCPDMIGGGEFTSFLNNATLDQDLVVRSAQIHALMPMMQFSVAPWRILDKAHFDAVKKAVDIRKKMTPIIMNLAKEAAQNGCPIVRTMEYVFPKSGYENVKDQFFLGDAILVAPIVEKNAKTRKVLLPKGTWLGFDGKTYKGDSAVTIAVGLETLPYFEKVK